MGTAYQAIPTGRQNPPLQVDPTLQTSCLALPPAPMLPRSTALQRCAAERPLAMSRKLFIECILAMKRVV